MNTPLWNWVLRRRIALANLSLIVVLVIGSGYVARYVLRFSLIPHTFTVTVELDTSGGILEGNDVTFRGTRVGDVADVRVAGDGIEVVADIDDSAKIPVGGTVHIGRLSAAGEQYLDFRPDSDTGPYLSDGAVIARSVTSVPVPVQNLLTDLSGLIGGMNPERLTVVIDELDKALAGGPDRLRNMISGISRAMAGLTDLLPQTEQLIRNLEVIAETTSHAQPDLSALTQAGSALFQQAQAADQEIRRFLDQGPGQLATLGNVVDENQDPLTDLVTNFVAITKAAKLRQPAIEALFPSLRKGIKALGVPAHDGAYHTLADFYPRPSCEYDTIPVTPTKIQTDTRVRLYNYCLTANPALQVRGSANAPRPNVPDNGSGPPPGVTGDELSQPIPPGPIPEN